MCNMVFYSINLDKILGKSIVFKTHGEILYLGYGASAYTHWCKIYPEGFKIKVFQNYEIQCGTSKILSKFIARMPNCPLRGKIN